MFGRTGRTAVGRHLAVFVGTTLVLGACVQIAGIEDPHPLNPEWANWSMPNPQGSGLPNLATYAISADKTFVTDKVTHLIWQREIALGTYTWEDANTYCADLVRGGFDDWRLPTAIEVISLVDFTKATPGPTIDQVAFPMTASDWFWTATQSAALDTRAWFVNFRTGETNANDRSAKFPVRCVRVNDA